MKKLKRLFANQSVIKSLYSKKMFGLAAAGAGFATLGTQAQAQTVIIQDGFTTADILYPPANSNSAHYGVHFGQQGTNAAGVYPDTTNLPGGNWQHINGAFYDANEYSNSGSSSNYFFTQNNAQFHNDASAGIALGAYNTGSLTISAGVFYNNNNGPVGSNGFALLGFSSQLNTASNYGPTATYYFTGLDVLPSGALQEYVNGATVGSPIAFGGTFSAYAHPGTTLSYTIDTSTGLISNVSFGGSTATYNFPTSGSFSNADTFAVEIGGQGANGSNTVVVNNFELLAPGSPSVPEPSTYALFASGALVLGAFHYRRRQRVGI